MFEENTGTKEMVEFKRAISAKQERVIYLIKREQSLQARYIYTFIFFITNLLAWFLRDYGQKFLKIFHYMPACGIEGDDCYHSLGVLRVSLGCFIFFFSMFVTTFRANKLHGGCNSWHSRWWVLKIVLYIAFLVVPFVIPVAVIQLYGKIARVGAGIFLLLQLISVIHFITWCNNHWMHSQSKHGCSGLLGLFLSTISYVACFFGIVLMFFIYAPNLCCSFSIFFITLTGVLVMVMMVVSLHSKVNRGLLSSGIMGAYIIFLCWSAIQSEPPIENCNTRKLTNGNDDWTTVISFLLAIGAIVMATFSTGIDSKSFQFLNDDVQQEEDIPYKYDFFHFIYSIGAMHFAMLLISWELEQTTRKWTIDVGWVSTWVKIINEWLAACIYLCKLVSPMTREKATDPEAPPQQILSSEI